jgi:hypothetical protein
MAPNANALTCPHYRDGHCTLVAYTADPKAAAICSLQTGRHEDCPIYRDAPRGRRIARPELAEAHSAGSGPTRRLR